MEQQHDVRSAEPREAVREFVTMALYVSLSLLAVVLATPLESSSERGALAVTVLFTSLGLVVAHLLAFSISSRLVSKGQLDAESRQILGVQIAAGLAVAVVATVPVAVLPPPTGSEISGLLLVAFVAVVGYLAARQAQVSRARAVVYVGIVILLAVGVLAIKSLVH